VLVSNGVGRRLLRCRPVVAALCAAVTGLPLLVPEEALDRWGTGPAPPAHEIPLPFRRFVADDLPTLDAL
jgi:hypothetical protein